MRQIRMATGRFKQLAGLVACAMASSCSPSYFPASDEVIAFLASDAHVSVGGEVITIPFIALSGYVRERRSVFEHGTGNSEADQRLEAFRMAAASRRTAPPEPMVELHVRPYGWNDEDMRFGRICPLLGREWAKSVCNDPWAPLLQALPRYRAINLVDLTKSERIAGHFRDDGRRLRNRVRAMRLRSDRASILCDEPDYAGKTHCMAAILIQGNLGAAWYVWNEPDETPSEMAQREGDAIRNFVLLALRPSEDFPALLENACKDRRPGSEPGQDGDVCAGRKIDGGKR